MRIGIDAKRLFSNFTGLGNYSRTIVGNFHDSYPQNELYLYSSKVIVNDPTSPFLSDKSFQVRESKGISSALWRSYGISNQLKKDRLDLYHGLSHELPFSIRETGIKNLVSIHDLIFKHFPDQYSYIDRNIYDRKFRFSCQVSDRIIAISQSTKKDLVEFYAVDPNKIEVIYQSCDPVFYKKDDEELLKAVKKNSLVPPEYFLFVGSIIERKNLRLIIEAMRQLPKEERIPVLVVGKGKSYLTHSRQMVRKYALDKYFIWLDNVHDNNALKKIYKGATALIYPSMYEGFGLPVVEALLSGTPVITSNISSLPEAGGPGSLYVDPGDAEDLADKMTQLLGDEIFRKDMISKGYQYAMDSFDPGKTSAKLWSCYQDTFKGI